MRIVSLNLNKRLRSEKNIPIIEKWLSDKKAELLFVQEPWDRGRKEIVRIPSYLYLGGTDGIGAWIHESYIPQCTELLEENWQKLTLDSLVIHNIYLSASDSKKRVESLEQLKKQIDKEKSLPVLIVGDFNLAPNPEDGIFGKKVSKFTSKCERDALNSLLSNNNLIDSTASNSQAENKIFTFEREIRGEKSCFRCDLALVSESILNDLKVDYDHSVRVGEGSFTDHSAILIDIPNSLMEIRTDKCNSYKTAISRNDSSRLSKKLSAYIRNKYPERKIKRIFDYGCGHGKDIGYYKNEFDCDVGGWDPYISNSSDCLYGNCPYGKYDIITCVYVLNVLPNVSERRNTINRAISYLADGGFLVVATRSVRAVNLQASIKGWRLFNDGYCSSESRGTFQKGIDAEEIEKYLFDSGLKVKLSTPSELKIQDATVVLIELLNKRDL